MNVNHTIEAKFEVDSVAVLAVPAGTPELALWGARPNPAVQNLNVSFALPNRESAKLELFDVAGRRLNVVDAGSLGAGRHEINLAAGLPLRAGSYIIRLTQNGRTLSARAIVLH